MKREPIRTVECDGVFGNLMVFNRSTSDEFYEIEVPARHYDPYEFRGSHGYDGEPLDASFHGYREEDVLSQFEQWVRGQ